jgi:hypothetical protein
MMSEKTRHMEEFMAETLEIVSFRLKPGTEADFVGNNGVVSDWLPRQPGFLSRHLGQREDGSWVDVVRWRSLEQAQEAAQRIVAEIEPASVETTHANVALSS